MKKPLLLFIFFLFFIFTLKGQNLVPNGDFEQYSGCPDSYSQLDSALNWFNPAIYPPGQGGSPDYFNQCSTTTVSVPFNFSGYQPAHSGAGYGGIIIFTKPPYIPDQREYMECGLTSPLVANGCYHFEMYINRGNDCQYATDDIGVYFSTTAITGVNNFNPLPFTPQINNPAGYYLIDSVNWVLLSGNYTAAGGENYFIIGNFKYDTATTALMVNFSATYQFAYYYIDDVSLTPCTGIDFPNFPNLENLIYPNPVKDWLNVQLSNSSEGVSVGVLGDHSDNFQNKKTEIKITDVLGKEIYRDQFLTSDFRLQTSCFQSGIYFIEIHDGKNIFVKKFIKE